MTCIRLLLERSCTLHIGFRNCIGLDQIHGAGATLHRAAIAASRDL